MPHVVVLYSGNLETRINADVLCRSLAQVLLTMRTENAMPVFPPGGVRVYAYPAVHYAISDGGIAGKLAGGDGDYGFIYINLRMGRGRSAEVQQTTGDALLACAKNHLSSVFSESHIGLTVQIDESFNQVFDGKYSTIHPLFQKINDF